MQLPHIVENAMPFVENTSFFVELQPYNCTLSDRTFSPKKVEA